MHQMPPLFQKSIVIQRCTCQKFDGNAIHPQVFLQACYIADPAVSRFPSIALL